MTTVLRKNVLGPAGHRSPLRLKLLPDVFPPLPLCAGEVGCPRFVPGRSAARNHQNRQVVQNVRQQWPLCEQADEIRSFRMQLI